MKAKSLLTKRHVWVLISMTICSRIRGRPGTTGDRNLLGFPSSITHQQLEACVNSLLFSCHCCKVFCQENNCDSTFKGSASWHNLLSVLKAWRKKPPLKLKHPLIHHPFTLFSGRSGPLFTSATPPRSSWGSPSQIRWTYFWKVSTPPDLIHNTYSYHFCGLNFLGTHVGECRVPWHALLLGHWEWRNESKKQRGFSLCRHCTKFKKSLWRKLTVVFFIH